MVRTRKQIPRIITASTALMVVFFSNTASAVDVSDGFYLDVSGGPSVFMLHMNDDAIDDLIANTYWGVNGRIGICSKGPINVCGGLTGFSSLESSSQAISNAIGGGKTETQVKSIGGYLQGTADFGLITLSPFVGYRQIYGDVSTENYGAIATDKINTGAYYGGLETSIKFFPTNLELGTRFEYGKSTSNIGSKDLEYGIGSAFLRMRF